MSADKDWLRQNHEALHDQANQTVSFINQPANRERMGLGSATPAGTWYDGEFTAKYTAYTTAYTAWSDPAERTHAKQVDLENAEEQFKPVYRKLYNAFLKESPFVTDNDLIHMGLPERPSGERHPSRIPVTHPAAEVNTSELRQVGINYFENDGTHKKAKPEGVHGAEIRWRVFPQPQEVRLDDLTQSSFDTRTPLTLEFADEDRGKTLYFALRWENTRGEKGPFGPVLSTVIP